jgi:TorA maturation chaperone TorD
MTGQTDPLEPTDALADIHALLARGLRQPDDALRRAIEDGTFKAELRELIESAGIEVPVTLTPPPVADRDLLEDYTGLFEAMHTPFAPPAESPYKPWYGDRDGGLLDGPPASNMAARLEHIGAEVPPEYPPDHIAVLLEYGSYLLESGSVDAYRAFVSEHLDWIPAFRRVVEDARAGSPFHRWVVALTGAILATVRHRLDIDQPASATIDRMVERVDGSDRAEI